MNNLPTHEKRARYGTIDEGLLVGMIAGLTLIFVKMALEYPGPLTINRPWCSLASPLFLPIVLQC